MKLAELDALCTDRKMIRHAGTTFFNTRDAAVAADFGARGARVKDCGYATAPMWEVHVAGMLDFIGEPTENEDDPVRDARPRIVLEHYRERDGYAWPSKP
ncbi:MAG TPA: hypothetical protein VNC18_17635 [Gemmatimonadaceae bacterium]|jgi:hypothetical protein|nr:hypothetical protein [Gemmatimonadaceae bacterium]